MLRLIHQLMRIASVMVLSCLAFVVAPSIASATVPQPTSALPLTGANQIGNPTPGALASDGTNVWIVNPSQNSVTERSAASGQVVQTVSGSSFGFADPEAVASDGMHVWIVNQVGSSVTELSARSGALIQVIDLSHVAVVTNAQSFAPDVITTNGTDVWIGGDANSLVELANATGAVVSVITPKDQFNTFFWIGRPSALASDANHVWVQEEVNFGEPLMQLSASTGVVEHIETGYAFWGLSDLTSDGTHVWAIDGSGSNKTLSEFSVATGDLVNTFSDSKYAFTGATQVASDGTDVWVGNPSNNSVTELKATTGQLVGVYSSSLYGFHNPVALAADRSHVWVVNQDNNSVTELAAPSGSLTAVLTSDDYGLKNPGCIASTGTDVWVPNYDNNSVTKFSAITGKLEQVIGGSQYAFNGPDAVATDGINVWIANWHAAYVTEIAASTGAFVRNIPTPTSGGSGYWTSITVSSGHVWVADGGSIEEHSASTGALEQSIGRFNLPIGSPVVTSDASHIWVANNGTPALSEYSASNGAFIRNIDGTPDGFLQGAGAVSSDGTNVWVANGSQVMQVNASTGAVVQVIQGQQYQFQNISDIASDGTHVWVTGVGNRGGISEFSATTGNVEQIVTLPAPNLNQPTFGNLALDAHSLWVTEPQDNSIAQFPTTNMSSSPTITNLPVSGSPGGGFTAVVSTTGDGTTSLVSRTPSVCATSGLNVTYLAAGFCIISANVTQTSDYLAANGESETIPVSLVVPTSPSITNIPGAPVYGGSFTPSISTSSNGTKSVTSNTTATCTVTAGQVHFVAVGSCTLVAHVAATSSLSAADGAAQSLTVGQASPTTPSIINAPPSPKFGATFVPVVSTSGDGSKSVSSSTPAVCQVASSTVSFVGVGTCTLVAHVAAGTNFLAANGQSQNYAIGKATPTSPKVANIPNPAKKGTSFIASISTNSDGAKSVSSQTPLICSTNGLKVSLIKPGTCSLVASVAPSNHYLPATEPAAQSFVVIK